MSGPLLNLRDARRVWVGTSEAERIWIGSAEWERLSDYDLLILNDSPTAYWPCTDEDGTAAAELVNGWDGIYHANVQKRGATAPDGTPVANFTGSGAIRVPNTDNRLQPTEVFTLEIWFRSDGYADYSTIWGFNTNNWDARLNPPGNNYTLHWYNENSNWDNNFMPFTPPTSPTDGSWHHMVLCRDSSGPIRKYWDGQLVYSGSGIGGSPRDLSGQANMVIGATRSGSRPWTGPVCRVATYDYILPDTDVLAHYQKGMGL